MAYILNMHWNHLNKFLSPPSMSGQVKFGLSVKRFHRSCHLKMRINASMKRKSEVGHALS